MKRNWYIKSFLAGLLFLSVGMISCQPLSKITASNNDMEQMNALQAEVQGLKDNMSTMETDIQTLRDDNARLSQALTEANKNIADLTAFNANYTTKDVKALYYMLSSTGGFQYDFYQYLQQRYGKPVIETAHASSAILIDLPDNQVLRVKVYGFPTP
jgi:outer membrane murein-binding lipoprotein Lpp